MDESGTGENFIGIALLMTWQVVPERGAFSSLTEREGYPAGQSKHVLNE
jgi:hypothetical protein